MNRCRSVGVINPPSRPPAERAAVPAAVSDPGVQKGGPSRTHMVLLCFGPNLPLSQKAWKLWGQVSKAVRGHKLPADGSRGHRPCICQALARLPFEL